MLSRRRVYYWALVPVALSLVLGIVAGEAQQRAPDGTRPKGSGPVSVTNVRVVDGDSIDVYVDGKRTAIGIIGVDAPSGNTDCGKQATGMMWGLVKAGLNLEDDPDETLDDRGRRMYRAQLGDGRFVDETLVRAGVAKVTGKGARRAQLAEAEAEVRDAKRGCAWGGPPVAPAGPEQPASNPVASALGVLGSLGLGTLSQPATAYAAPLAAPSYPAGFAQDVVAANLDRPTNFEFVPDGRIFVAQQNGIIRVIKNGALLPTALLDISDRVNDHWDHGLLGMALDPNFSQNGFLYLLYTLEHGQSAHEGKKVGRVARFTVVGDTANPNTQQILLGSQFDSQGGCEAILTQDCIPSEGLSHSVGALKFADDGSLFLTTGDAASFNVVDDLALRAQNLSSLGGKVLRINTSGQGLSDNPHYVAGQPNNNQSKVWARGVRNAFRFNVKPGTGVPYLGDVGWNNVEEINAATPGANLGWPCYEGIQRQDGYQSKSVCTALYAQGAGAVRAPIVEWSHNQHGGCCGAAATGGAFLQGTNYPAQFQGAYFYADFAKEFIRFFRTDANHVLVPGSDMPFAEDTEGPVDMELGPDQNLYYLAINTGQLRRIRYTTAGNRPPQANAAATPNEGTAPLAVQFSSAGTLDPDADPMTYEWNFDDGSAVVTSPNPQKTFTQNGIYDVTLTVRDGRGGSDTAEVQVSVGNRRPAATITAPLASQTYKVGDTINFAGTATDPDGGTPAITWELIAKHCPGGTCHTHQMSTFSGPSGSFVMPDHGDENHFEFVMTATDTGGLTDVKTVAIQPQTVQLNFVSTPSGRQLIYDGTTIVTPFTKPTVPGSEHTIEAPNQPGFQFGSWSDGGAQQHDITVSTAATTTLTATFTAIPTVTFDDKSGQDQPLNGQYPASVIDWGTGKWYHSGPWGALTTKSASFNGPGVNSTTFDFVTPRKLLSVRVFNGGGGAATVTLACAGQTKSQSVPTGQIATLETGWTGGCTTVTATSTNGWDTNFDDIVHDSAGPPPPDTTPPTITAGPSAAPTATAATITWTTDEASDSQVEYGPNGTFGSSTPLAPATVTSHSVALSGLTAGTSYSYRVKSKDAAGNLRTSGNLTFSTTAVDTTAPVISSVASSAITSSSATVTWTTNEASDTQVEYGTAAPAYGSSTTLAPAPVTSHSANITGLLPNTLYHFRVKSKDAAGNLATSADFTFTTTAAPTTQTITFDDKAGQDQPLDGLYPTNVINWGTGGWYHSGPWGAFTTKSASFAGGGQANATLTFVSARRLVSVRAYNGGGAAATVTLTCNGQPAQPVKTQSIPAGQAATITTGWTGTCTTVQFGTSNGWDTNFDDIVIAPN